ncbi:tRNA/rRNA cytosine-C5-methylase [Opitutaceae bacterium TAV1]|nr:tRNA/rRNA cytosine-C5-methylase [Opitutaceae bacterium TAV1]
METAPVTRTDSWLTAARLLTRWLDENARIDLLLAELPPSLGRAGRARCQHLLLGALRHLGRIEAAVTPLVERMPRPEVQAVFLLSGFELIDGSRSDDEGFVAKVVHHAVEKTRQLASPAEARMVNAVVRKLAATFAAATAPGRLASAPALGEFYSHPAWMVERWLARFGAEATRALLEWNLRPAPVYARWRHPEKNLPADAGTALVPTSWPQFYEVRTSEWPRIEAMLRTGDLFLQDPSTRHAVDLLAPLPGEAILDACAAPGGKSLKIADRMRSGRIISVDLPGPRQTRLEENLSRAPAGVQMERVPLNLLQGQAGAALGKLAPGGFAAVLVDVPCSNTGVMRHRVDVKWRLQQTDFAKHARQQYELLEAVSRHVAPGGRLVYSTCSLEQEENEAVVETFLQKCGGQFRLEETRLLRPWIDGHDGAGVFRFRRSGGQRPDDRGRRPEALQI